VEDVGHALSSWIWVQERKGALGFLRGLPQSSERGQRTANRRSQAAGSSNSFVIAIVCRLQGGLRWELLTSFTEMNCLEQVKNLLVTERIQSCRPIPLNAQQSPNDNSETFTMNEKVLDRKSK
jgi:hypothetical protein